MGTVSSSGWVRGLGESVIDAAVAGLVVGVVEAIVLGTRGAAAAAEWPWFVVVASGLTVVPMVVIGVLIVAAIRLVGRVPRVAAVGRALARPGVARVEILAAVAVGTVAAGVVWWIGFSVVAYAVGAFKAHRPMAMLSASVSVAAALAALGISMLLGPPVMRWCGRRAALVRATSGGAGTALALVLLAIVVVGTDRLVTTLAPAWDPVPAYLRALAVAALLVVAMVRPARRLGRRGAAAVGGLALALALAAPLVISRDQVTRGVVVSRGVVTAGALDLLAAPFDGDGDGFVDVLGMVDCDDAAASVHPGAVELAGNGIDDDCVGGDADPAALAARRPARPSADATAPRLDVVLLTIDSLRADHTSLHGYPRPTTPAMAALAARGVRFDHALSTAPCTRYALPALLFGRHTHTLPFTTGPYPLMTPHALPTLASSLTAAGYRTAAILSRDLPLSPPAFAGFRDVITVEQRRPERNVDNAGAVAERALTWLATPADGPRFLWVHMLDPHQPYEVPRDTPRFPGALGHYDAEIASADAAVGRIIAALDPARTIVVVTADHGEAFLDHHQRFHGSTLHEEELHVPLVVTAPGLAASTITPSVSHLDVAPTLLDLVGVGTPAGMQGQSLTAALRGAPLAPRVLVTASKPSRLSGRSLVAAYDGRTKIIRDLDAWTVEVYDLVADPGEHAPRRHGAEVARMIRLLDDATTAELATLPAVP